MAATAERQGSARGSWRRFAGAWPPSLAAAVSLLVLTYLLAVVRGAFDSATVLLSVAGGLLVLVLHRMFAMVQALARADAADSRLRADARTLTFAELREEKKRVLRAIKELDFDFELGKMSSEDHREVSDLYRLRAVEILRKLDDQADLHPRLAALVAEIEGRGAIRGDDDPGHRAPTRAGEPPGVVEPIAEAAADDAVPAPAGSQPQAAHPCRACATANDADARFCKHCGEELRE